MNLKVLFTVLAAASLMFASPAFAQWLMDGSHINLSIDRQDNVTLTYMVPRPELAQYGVRPGTLLFRGALELDGTTLDGTSYVFKKNCSPIPYDMSGTLDVQTGQITLYGASPEFVSETSCHVIRYNPQGKFSTMFLLDMSRMD